MTRTPFDELGGEIRLRIIIDDFVDRVTADAMIGFFFRGVNLTRLKELEYQTAARMLGADVAYQGRPLAEAHRSHRIMGGQFARRRKILEETLAEHRVPEGVREVWLAHTDALRGQITGASDVECE